MSLRPFRSSERPVRRGIRSRCCTSTSPNCSGGKTLAEPGQAVLPGCRFEHLTVDDDAWFAAVSDIKNSANIGGPVAGEALVGPAKGVGSEDHIVELEDAIVGVRRLFLQDIESRPGGPP